MASWDLRARTSHEKGAEQIFFYPYTIKVGTFKVPNYYKKGILSIFEGRWATQIHIFHVFDVCVIFAHVYNSGYRGRERRNRCLPSTNAISPNSSVFLLGEEKRKTGLFTSSSFVNDFTTATASRYMPP